MSLNPRHGSVGILEAAKQIELDDVPDRCERIFQPDFLSLAVSAAAIGNRHLVHHTFELGGFRGYFKLETEARTSDRHVADDVSTESFITGGDVGDIHVGKKVGKKC